MSTADARAAGIELWTWATESGELESAPTAFLVQQLRSMQLPPSTLVWKEGWAEWLPAERAEELSAAFPDLPEGRFLVARQAPQVDVPPAPMHDPTDASFYVDETTRVLPCPEQDVVTSEVPAAALLDAARAMNDPEPPDDLGLVEAVLRSSRPPPPAESPIAEPPMLGDLHSSQPEFTAEVPTDRTSRSSHPAAPLADELGLSALLHAEESRVGKRTRGRTWWWGILLIIALGTLAARWLAWGSLASLLGPAHSGSEPSGSSQATKPHAGLVARSGSGVGTCKVGSAVRLDDWAISEVRPQVAWVPPGAVVVDSGRSGDAVLPAARLAVGYARTHGSAAGLLLEPRSLAVAHRRARATEQQIFSVTPLLANGKLEFHSERRGTSVAHGVALDVDPPLRVGMNEHGIVAGPIMKPAERVWSLPAGTLISVPASAPHSGGFTLAMLTGRDHGPVRVGVMSERGRALSLLGQIGDSTSSFGPPTVASGGGQTALAVASRSPSDSRSSIWLSVAPQGQLPSALQPFESEPATSADARAPELGQPALAALPNGGFALLYARGRGVERQVRLQLLSAHLRPSGAPLLLTPPEPHPAEVRVGSLHWVDQRLLAFYFMGRSEGYALWVKSAECDLD